MQRINVVEAGALTGWFDLDAIQGRWSDQDPETRNGSRGLGRGLAILLTAGGRWVEERWTNWSGEKRSYRFVEPATVWKWLLSNGFDAAAEHHFGPVEPERGPGRPEVGPRVIFRMPEDLLAALDAHATRQKITRAEAARRLLAAGLGN